MKDKEKTKNQPISEPTKRKQILIVEDERVVAKDIKMSVQKLGYAVSEIVFSGEDAVKKAEELHPDLVLMDIVLEGKMNGINAAEIIRSRFNIPIVYLTAYSDKSTLKRAKKTEPFGYILKPFDYRDLSITIEMALYKHKMENLLKESEERFRQFFENAPEYCYIISPDGKIVNINSSALTALGYTKEEIAGKPLLTTTCAPSSIEKTKELFMRWKKTGKIRDEEITIITKKGKERTVLLSADSVRDSAGKLVHSISIQRDITKRKRAQEAMQESEEFNVALFQHNPIQTIAVDNSGKVANFNMSKKTSGDRLPNIGDVMYKDYAGKHEINMHAELMKCIKSKKVKRFPEMKYDGKFLDITLAPFPHGAIITTQDITERKRMEDALKESEERYKDLVEKARIGILIDDRKGNIKYFNEKYMEILGYSRKETKKLSIQSIVHPDDVEKVLKYHKNRIQGKRTPSRYEFRAIKKDRSVINLEVDAVALRVNGKITGSRSYTWNITERKKAEAALYESEEKYRTLTENVNVGIYRSAIKPDGKFIEANPAFIKIFGYKNRDDMLATRILNIYQIPEDRKKFIEKLSREGLVRNEELKLKKKDGSPIICSVSAVTIKDKKGKAKYYDGIIENITERKLAEEVMRKSEMTYRALFESGNDPVILFSLNGTIVSANQKAAEILGYNVEELIGMSYKDIIASSEIKDAGNKLKSLQEGKTFLPYERTVYKKNGTEFPSEVNLSLVQDENNKPVFLQSIFRDITERKRADDELKTSREQLRNLAAHLQAVREGERTSIAREIHDDLGQTMTALKMDLSLLGTKLPKDQESLLKKTKSMSKLIDSTIQTVQRISAELRPGVLDDIGLTAALEWQGGEFQKRTGIKCELTVDPEDFFLDKDCSTAIFRIFQETLTNVARHSKAKWVKVNLKKKARRLELKIRDNGRGITEEQISNSKSFGLIGIRERVQFIGGEVEIRGIQNRGTTLKAWIPLPKDKK